jgi:hypothetical protein
MVLVQSCVIVTPSSIRPISLPTTTEADLLEDLSFVRVPFLPPRAAMSGAGSSEGRSQPFLEVPQQRGPLPMPPSVPASPSPNGAAQHREEPRVLSLQQRQQDYAKESRHNVQQHSSSNADSTLSGGGSAGSLSSNYSSSDASSQEDEAVYRQLVAQHQLHQEQYHPRQPDTLQSIQQRLATQLQQGLSPPQSLLRRTQSLPHHAPSSDERKSLRLVPSFFLQADHIDTNDYGSFVDTAEGDDSDRQPVVMFARPTVTRRRRRHQLTSGSQAKDSTPGWVSEGAGTLIQKSDDEVSSSDSTHVPTHILAQRQAEVEAAVEAALFEYDESVKPVITNREEAILAEQAQANMSSSLNALHNRSVILHRLSWTAVRGRLSLVRENISLVVCATPCSRPLADQPCAEKPRKK